MMFNDFKDKCFYCERPFNVAHYGSNKPLAKTRDHIIPVCEGGTNRSQNMVDSCIECNNFKADLSLESFVSLIYWHIETGTRFKTIPDTRFHLIAKKAESLIPYVKQKGKGLYRNSREVEVDTVLGTRKRKKKESLVGSYLKRHAEDITLSVNNNYSDRATFFELAEKQQKERNIINILHSEPEPNFHYE